MDDKTFHSYLPIQPFPEVPEDPVFYSSNTADYTRRIIELKQKLEQVQDAAQAFIQALKKGSLGTKAMEHLDALTCSEAREDSTAKNKSAFVPLPVGIHEAMKRVAAYKQGRTASEIYGEENRRGYHDDCMLIADYLSQGVASDE